MTASGAPPRSRAATWYRSDQERNKSVRRRANPWYRRFARGLIGLGLLAALGVGLYFGALELQNYLERDRLPAIGAEVPEIRATSFQVRSSSPAPEVDGTVTIDRTSRAFEFLGRNGGPHTGVHVVSVNGSDLYIREGQGDWAVLTDADTVTGGLSRQGLRDVVRYLTEAENADTILTNRLRRGYVDLIEQASEGLGENELTRYEMEIDTLEFSDDYPLQWQNFQATAIPRVRAMRSLRVIIWLDADDVLVRVRDEQTNWSWERLTYSDLPFTPIDPAVTLLDATTESTDAATETPTTESAGDG